VALILTTRCQIKEWLQNLWSGLKEDIRYQIYKKTLPVNPRHDDIYLVEFPKSGVTWLSFLIANVNIGMSGLKKEINFYNIHQHIHDVHRNRFMNLQENNFPYFRFIKSHSFNPFYNQVILLIRNPYAVMESYYYFLKDLKQIPDNLKVYDFVRDQRYGIDAWVRFMDKWHNDAKVTQRIYVVRYEDLIADASKTLSRLYKHLGFLIKDDILKIAVKNSDFNKMRTLENNYARYSCIYKVKFLRHEKCKDFFDVQSIEYIKRRVQNYFNLYWSDNTTF
jgi:hypothetical protein